MLGCGVAASSRASCAKRLTVVLPSKGTDPRQVAAVNPVVDPPLVVDHIDQVAPVGAADVDAEPCVAVAAQAVVGAPQRDLVRAALVGVAGPQLHRRQRAGG